MKWAVDDDKFLIEMRGEKKKTQGIFTEFAKICSSYISRLPSLLKHNQQVLNETILNDIKWFIPYFYKFYHSFNIAWVFSVFSYFVNPFKFLIHSFQSINFCFPCTFLLFLLQFLLLFFKSTNFVIVCQGWKFST